jgi:HEAT repeat protein
MKTIRTILLFCFCITAIGHAEDAVLKKKLDSLFVIASSGEVDHRDQNEPAMDSIAKFGLDAVPYLVDKFTTKSARERWTVIWTLQRIGAKAVPYLVQSLNRPDGLVVERVCFALGELRDTGAVVALMNSATHSRWQVRNEAVGALGKIGDKRGGPAAVAALRDTIDEVRKSGAVSCGLIKHNDAIPSLIQLFGDSFYGARMSAQEALTKLDTVKVRQVLGGLIQSDTTALGDIACDVFAQITDLNSLQVLASQLHASRFERRAHAALGIITADPTNNCGFHDQFSNDTYADPLTRQKIKSALAVRPDAKK